RCTLAQVVGGDDAQLVCVGLRLGREAFANVLDITNGGQEAICLIEVGVLPVGNGLFGCRNRVKVIRDVVDGNVCLVIGRIEEVFKVVGIVARSLKRHAHEFCVRADAANALHSGVVALGVLLRGCGVLALRLVEYLPHGDLVMVAGVVAKPVLIGEASVDIPTHQAAKVVAQLLPVGMKQFSALCVVPRDLVGV